IFDSQQHHARNRADGGYLEKIGDLTGHVSFAEQRMGEFERNADTRQVLVRIFAAGLIGIYNGDCRRIASYFVRKMVICDDNIETMLFCPFDRLEAANTAVDA